MGQFSKGRALHVRSVLEIGEKRDHWNVFAFKSKDWWSPLFEFDELTAGRLNPKIAAFENSFDHLGLILAVDKGYDSHLTSALQTDEWGHFVDILNHRRPSGSTDFPERRVIFKYRHITFIGNLSCLGFRPHASNLIAVVSEIMKFRFQ